MIFSKNVIYRFFGQNLSTLITIKTNETITKHGLCLLNYISKCIACIMNELMSSSIVDKTSANVIVQVRTTLNTQHFN